MKQLIIRFVITMSVLALMSRIIYFLFTKPVDKPVETILNVVMGGLLVSLHKMIEHWFHRNGWGKKDDDDQAV